MRKLHIDIETFSVYPLKGQKTVGLYKYAANCKLLLVAVAYDDGPVILYDLFTDVLPAQLLKDLQDPEIIKFAYNAPFEIACLSECLGIYLDPAQWFCVMSMAFMAGITLGLDGACTVLNVSDKKDKAGDALIQFFCVPCKPTKVNGFITRRMPDFDLEKWFRFGEYCKQDVRTEIAVYKALQPVIKIPKFERLVWALDQKINNRGLRIHLNFVNSALELNKIFRKKVLAEAVELTGLNNPNSRDQLIKWLEEETETKVLNLKKENIPGLLEKFDNPTVKRVLDIRGELSKTSVKKYDTMLRQVLECGRIKGMHQYCGAGRTWRFAGRGLQIHNFVKGKYHKQDLELCRNTVLDRDYAMLDTLYGRSIPDTLSQLLRTAIIPDKGKRLLVSDFKAIEAVILAWLADEKWRLEVFRTHGKIYEASAAKILKKEIKDVTPEERNKVGKVSELALGYAGSVNALIKMATTHGIVLEERTLKPQVDKWRLENPGIVKLWAAMNSAAIKAINKNERVSISEIYKNGERLVNNSHRIAFEYKRGYLIMHLPSGHALYYYNATLIPGQYGVQIQYWGLDGTTKKWCRQRTYGGKLVENACQAIGRDCLVQGMYNLQEAGYETILHVHDESVNECAMDFGSVEEMNELMCRMPSWADGMPIKAEGFETMYYCKD